MSEPICVTGLAGSRDEQIFGELYRRHYSSIVAYCRRRVSSDLVDDAVADTFLTAWRRLGDVPSGDQTIVWLYSVAYRVVGHQWRSTARRRRLENRLRLVDQHPLPAIDDELFDSAQHRLVRDAARCLNPTDAEVLRLAAWEQLAISDIAVVLDIAPNAVKQRLHRAKRNLADEYRRLESRLARTPTPDAPKGGVR